MGETTIIGIDLDNTIVQYDELFYRVGLEKGLINTTVPQEKKHIRDVVRKLPDGEIEWQRLQAIVYGPRMMEATMAPGVTVFFRACIDHNVKFNIISHKTSYANYDETNTNLRTEALAWLESKFSLSDSGFGFTKQNVYFECTRNKKLARIQSLRCSHFIDDLEETFLSRSFPDGVSKLLYSTHGTAYGSDDLSFIGDWPLITKYLFSKYIGH